MTVEFMTVPSVRHGEGEAPSCTEADAQPPGLPARTASGREAELRRSSARPFALDVLPCPGRRGFRGIPGALALGLGPTFISVPWGPAASAGCATGGAAISRGQAGRVGAGYPAMTRPRRVTGATWSRGLSAVRADAWRGGGVRGGRPRRRLMSPGRGEIREPLGPGRSGGSLSRSRSRRSRRLCHRRRRSPGGGRHSGCRAERGSRTPASSGPPDAGLLRASGGHGLGAGPPQRSAFEDRAGDDFGAKLGGGPARRETGAGETGGISAHSFSMGSRGSRSRCVAPSRRGWASW